MKRYTFLTALASLSCAAWSYAATQPPTVTPADATTGSAAATDAPSERLDSKDASRAPKLLSGRVRVTLKSPIALTREPVKFESVFEQEARPQGEVAVAPGAQGGGAARQTKEIVGREIADFRIKAGNGKYMIEDEFGEIRILPQSNVASVEPAPDTTVEELREKYKKELLEEFGSEFKVKATEHFLIVSNASESYVDWCARLFERLEEGFRLYARKNGIQLEDRGEPLVAVVFARQVEFIRYASVETGAPDKLAAYYNMQTNRVALYDLSNVEGVASQGDVRRRSRLTETREILSRPNAAFNVATVIHEATHQIAFNRGLFLRSGPIALWSAEGLSLVFETPNGMATQGGWSFRGSFPKNERMIGLFLDHIDEMDGLFKAVVAQDEFYRNLEGSYAASWALFYYLYRKKPVELAKYLQFIAEKTPCTVYPAQERLADFEKFFGDDWEKLSAAVVRFVKRL